MSDYRKCEECLTSDVKDAVGTQFMGTFLAHVKVRYGCCWKELCAHQKRQCETVVMWPQEAQLSGFVAGSVPYCLCDLRQLNVSVRQIPHL